jgi:hypothetical protein
MMEILKMITMLVWIVVGLLMIASVCVSLTYMRGLWRPFKNINWNEEDEA